jgi:type IV pilus assembly protein PilN
MEMNDKEAQGESAAKANDIVEQPNIPIDPSAINTPADPSAISVPILPAPTTAQPTPEAVPPLDNIIQPSTPVRNNTSAILNEVINYEENKAKKAQPAPKLSGLAKLREVGIKQMAKDSLSVGKNSFVKFSDEYEAVIGVDITPHYIHLCEMKQTNGEWKLNTLASSSVHGKSQLSDIANDPDAYVDVLKQLLKQAKPHTKRAAIALPTSNAVVRIVTIPIMEEAQLQQAIDYGNFWQNLVQIQNLEAYSVFHQIIKIDKARNTMDILFVAAQLVDIERYTDIVKDAGLQPTIVDVSCFALLNATYINHEEKEENAAPTAYLQFGPDENYLVIKDGYEPFLYDIYVSDQERRALMENLDNHEALEKFLSRYATQAKQLITNHVTSYQTKPISTLHVASSLPMIETLVTTLKGSLDGYTINVCDFFDHIEVPKRLVKKADADENRSSWAVALGLAVHHLDVFGHHDNEEKEDKINLLPGRERFIRLERYIIEATIALKVITVAAFIGIIGTFANISFSTYELENDIAALSHVEELHKEKTELSQKLNLRFKKLAELDLVMKQIPSNQEPVLAAYNYLIDVIPDGVWLTEISFMKPSALVFKGYSVNDKRILKFINALNYNESLTKVSLQTMRTAKQKHTDGRTRTLKNFVMNIAFDPETIANKDNKKALLSAAKE